MHYPNLYTQARDPVRVPLLILLVSVLTACPEDPEAAGDDEVGDGDGDGDGDSNGEDGDDGEDGAFEGAPDPEPTDPLAGGMASACDLQQSELWESTRPPSSLGNGLVHDARLSLNHKGYEKQWLAQALGDGVPWSDFVGNFDAMAESGFRPAQLRSEVEVAPGPGDSVVVDIVDRSVYVSDDDANYRTEIETYLYGDLAEEQAPAFFAPAQLGARPTSIETFALGNVDAGVELGFSLAWVYDNSDLKWELRIGLSEAAMLDEVDGFAAQGYRPISISSRLRDGATEYAAIFVDDGLPSTDWYLTLGLEQDQLAAEVQAASEAGFYPGRVTAEQGAGSRLNVVWAKLPPGLAVEVRLDLTMATFQTQDAHWRGAGYHLETLDRYLVSGADRHMAVWVRYQPCMRWIGTSFEPGDPDYEARYKMFHDRAIAAADLAGTTKEGRLLRPSSTLHVFEGDELVLNRAYTFAPAVYPDTPLNAPMKLASVSKSITAAAVVKAMDEAGLDLTTPYTVAAGIEGAPVGMEEVTVLDVLRNMGGFRAEAEVQTKQMFVVSQKNNPISYNDHAYINASAHGVTPIDGQEMFSYAVLDGHLDTNDTDSYWDSGRYNDSQTAGRMHYSNPGYSMLGEVVAEMAGVPYEQYVLEHLAAPLNLENKLFPDPGHRKDARGPTLAALRLYLINEDHPYRFDPPGPTDPLPPLFGDEELSLPPAGTAPNYDKAKQWRKTQGPIDPAAPRFASSGRYSGNSYMGGAPLAAGGWYADGESLGILIRALNQTDWLMSSTSASRLWNPEWKSNNGWRAPGWAYVLGFYVRGNWVAWAGGSEGSMATVFHNRAYDFTVIHLANVQGNGPDEFINPLMFSEPSVWGISEIGKIFPCLDEPDTPDDECQTSSPSVPY